MKLFKIFLVLALLTVFPNLAFAEEFDPVSDLFSNDALLNLDLPTDFEKEDSATGESATPVFEFPPNKTEILKTSLVDDSEEIEICNGGAIVDHLSKKSSSTKLSIPQTDAPLIFFKNEENTSAPRFTLERQDVPTEISSFFYDSPTTTNLSLTGPEAAIAITLLFTLPAVWMFRKFLNA